MEVNSQSQRWPRCRSVPCQGFSASACDFLHLLEMDRHLLLKDGPGKDSRGGGAGAPCSVQAAGSGLPGQALALSAVRASPCLTCLAGRVITGCGMDASELPPVPRAPLASLLAFAHSLDFGLF